MVAKPNAALVDAYDTKHRAWVGQVRGTSPMLAPRARLSVPMPLAAHTRSSGRGLTWRDVAGVRRTACIPPRGGRAATTSSQMTSTGASACAEWYFLCVGVGLARSPVRRCPMRVNSTCSQLKWCPVIPSPGQSRRHVVAPQLATGERGGAGSGRRRPRCALSSLWARKRAEPALTVYARCPLLPSRLGPEISMAQRLREKLQRAMATPPDSQSEQSQASSHDFGGPKASQFEPGVKCARLALSSPDAAPAARWHMHQKSD